MARDDYAGAHKVFKVTLKLMMVFGLIFALFLYGMAGIMVDYGFIRDSRAYLPLVVLTPAVFFPVYWPAFEVIFRDIS